MIEKESLYEWQEEAYNKWKEHNKKAIVVSGTGSGKSKYAMYCMQENRCSTIIIVPTIVLQMQWKTEILENLDVEEETIGFVGDGEREFKPITIAIINSVRKEDLTKFDMIICDELHRYSSVENIKPLIVSKCKYKLGMTATLEKEKEIVFKDLIGDVCYVYGQKKAIADGILNEFILINRGVELTTEERHQYDKADGAIRNDFSLFNYNLGAVVNACKNYRHPNFHTAKKLMSNIQVRRMTCANSYSKIVEVRKIVKEHKDAKIIIFNEYISMAEQIYEGLMNDCVSAGMYHSDAKDMSVVQRFDEGKIRVLVACKSLNEGLNVRTANMGIIVSSNSVKRNTVQRLGRILRKAEGKGVSTLYQLYCKYTKDSKDIQEKNGYFSTVAKQIIEE